MTPEQQKLVQDVLVEVNKARKAMGLTGLLDLPRGVRENSGSCPLARCFPDSSVNGDTVEFEDPEAAELVAEAWGTYLVSDSDVMVAAPRCLNRFVFAFDSEYLTEYDLCPRDPDDGDGDDEEPDEEPDEQ